MAGPTTRAAATGRLATTRAARPTI